MGTPGVPVHFTEDQLRQVIKEKKGVLTHVAKELGYAYETIWRHVQKSDELIELVKEGRRTYKSYGCEIAENYLFNCMAQTEDRSNGVRAAIYYLNNNGKEFGYAPPQVNIIQNNEGAAIDKILGGFDKLHSEQKEAQPSDHNVKQACDVPHPAKNDIVQ